MKRYGLFYLHGHDGEMEENEGGEWVKYEDVAELQRQLDEANNRLNELNARVHQWHDTGLKAAQEGAQARQQRDTALAALGQVQAGAAELMAAADALLRERDNYRAACQAAAALGDRGIGS